MSYSPISDSDFVGPVRGTSAVWPALIANDAACFESYTPGFEVNPSATATALAREFRWKMYGMTDAPFTGGQTVGIRAVASSGPQNVTIAVGADSGTVAVSGDAWYSRTTAEAGPLEVVVSCSAPGAGTLAFSGLRASMVPTAPTPDAWPSGYRLVGSLWGTADFSVPSEIQSRLSTNPILLAIDRPVCVAAHVSDCLKSVSAKTLVVWGVYDETTWVRAGRLILPRCDTRERLFRVDAYTTDVLGGAEFSVKIGAGNDEQWTGTGWHSWQVRLGPTRHDIWATILAGAGNGAAIRTLTVWRTEE